MANSEIVVRGAREHNLRDVDLEIPRNKLVVMTGVSGSGKSSLAFDTLYAEGQRRYVESLSSYARQFLGQMPKPDVDSISGLAPTISIQQKTSSRNPRSTVGTITEIYDYLRVLYARVGTGHCPECGQEITAQSTERIVDAIALLPEGTKFQILAPVVQKQKGEFADLFEDLLKQGYLRARVDGEIVELTNAPKLKRHFKHDIEVVVDRLVVGKVNRARLAEAVEQAGDLSGGSVLVIADRGLRNADSPEGTDSNKEPATRNPQTEILYSTKYACTPCGIGFEPPSPQLFSFNSPLGMCLECNGLGTKYDFVLDRLIPDPSKSVAKGAIELLGRVRKIGRWRRHLVLGGIAHIEKKLGLAEGELLETPWEDVDEEPRKLFLYGTGSEHVTYTWRHSGGLWKHGGTWDGVVADLLKSYHDTRNPMRRRQLEKYMEFVDCPACGTERLNEQARNVFLTSKSFDACGDCRSPGCACNGKATSPPRPPTSPSRSKSKKRSKKGAASPTRLSLPQVCALSVADAAAFFEELELDETASTIAEEALKEIRGRLGFLLRCGLDYLTLDRPAPTLSGGESQRIRLAGQIGCGLVGVVYVLDEPSIGLHPRDNKMLLASLEDLRDQGNTVIVVEHDEETMRAADHIVDFGPGPGVRGGEIVVAGGYDDVVNTKRSVTGQYLSGKATIPVPKGRRPGNGHSLKLTGLRHNNLRNVDVEIPLGAFVCVTGVSGSGKSSFVNDVLWQVLNRDVNKGKGTPGDHDGIAGLEHVDKAIDIDQSPIGRTPRSNPATYVKLLDEVRKLFTQLPESKMRGYKPGRFSFNVAGGRCEACEGHGANKLEMDFLADIWVTCPVCNGDRFNHETLEVRYKGRNIAEILDMDVQEALEHFRNVPKVRKLLQTLHDVGLDYLKLGQPSPTLSGGEAQRIKLARELGKRSTGQTFYLLDEPTTGLHFADVHKLLDVLHGFVEAGNTVLVVEHSLDVVKTADWIVDLGLEGGVGGGRIVAVGTPEDVAACEESHTGAALRELPEFRDGAIGRSGDGGKRKGGRRKKKPLTSPSPNLPTPRWQLADSYTREIHNGESASIVVRGAEQHNLQHVDLEVPRNRMSVFSGPSGSGKTSLAMDTLYAEGQRRYVESLSAYARQFLGQMPKPRVEHVHGLSPAIAIEQKSTGHTPRSTVGTVTEIYDYLRVLYARLGDPYCPECAVPVETQTTDQVIDRLMSLDEGTKLVLLAPLDVAVGTKFETVWDRLQGQGFLRVRIDGTTHRLEDVPELDQRTRHEIEVVVDRIVVKDDNRGRIADSVESAFDLGKGMLRVGHVDADRDEPDWRVEPFSLHRVCHACGKSFERLAPHHFSFNSPLGWCESCEGLGTQQGTNLAVLLDDPHRSLADAAVAAWPDPSTSSLFAVMLDEMARVEGLPLDVPFNQLSPADQRKVLYGTGERWFEVVPPAGSSSFWFQYKGLFPAVEEASRVSYTYRAKLQNMQGEVPCSTCGGSRIREDAAAVRLRGKTIQQLCEMPLSDALGFLRETNLDDREQRIAGELLEEATGRLSFLVDVGLHYLTMSRPLPTLSGGETQRIRLAGQIGRALTGVLYVLDEPTIGLHPRDNGLLIRAIERLRDIGNTVLLVEHDREVIEASDRLFDFGPGAGRLGGTVVAEGTPKQLAKRKASLTGRYLSNKAEIPIPKSRRMASLDRVESQGSRVESQKTQADASASAGSSQLSTLNSQLPPGGGWLELLGARLNNLRDVDLRIPLGTFTVVTGVSGSGKSSLIEDTLARAVSKTLHRAQVQPGPHDEVRGLELVNKIIVVDQQPLGSTPASNPATYTGVFDHVRELFCRMPESKIRGYRPGRFSFNRPGGRCEDCEGNGQRCIEMHFLPDVWVECETCKGKRYNRETLAVRYRGKSIADVLEMPIGEANELFQNIPKIRAYLSTLCAIGLDYLTLGQPAPTLSGGEAQRVKLASELARPSTGQTLYVLDEPTTGLHFDDVAKLLKVLESLVEAGNTVVVVEHNLDVIKTADWIVDVGPDAGSDGGRIVVEGTPEDVVAFSKAEGGKRKAGELRSYTGEILADVLESGTRAEREVFDAKAAARKQEGDLELAQVGKDAKMPWERDGRRWHTADRLAHNGQPAKWEGEALAFVVDAIQEAGGFHGTNWGERGVVEVTNERRQGGWFLHALTGDEWLLTLKFRVKKSTFDQKSLARRLELKPVNDLDEIQVYNRGDRVKAKNLKQPWQEVTLTVHWLHEIDTPEFRDFLAEAVEAYFAQANREKLDPESLTPWKVLGRKWHVSRKGFLSGKKTYWEAETLERMFDLVERQVPKAKFDWGAKVLVNVKKGSRRVATIHTKRREGIDLVLHVEKGSLALGRIADYGIDREITPGKNGVDTARIRVRTDEQVDELEDLLAEVLG